MNNIIFNSELEEKTFTGLEKLYKAVSCTLGPKGKNVIISSDEGRPYITNDGVTIANAIKLEDEIENIIVEIVKEAANKTNDNAGDGTTTSIILSYEIYKEAIKHIKDGISKKQIINEIKEFASKIITEIEKRSIKKLTNKEIYMVAKVSSGDEIIAQLIKDACSEDEEINILIEESQTNETQLNIISGMKLESGFENYSLIEDNKNEIIIEKPLIKIENKILVCFNEIDKKYNLIICNDYDENILEDLKNYNKTSTNKIYLIKAPLYGEKREEIIKDIDYFIKEKNIEKAIIRKNHTILHTKNISSKTLNERINYLKERLTKEQFAFEKDIIKSRISNLKGKIACIKIGAPTEIERIEKKMKAEDAIFSVQNAKKYGISIGGGLTFYNISKELSEKTIGEQIMKKVLTKPIEKLFEISSLNYNELKTKLEGNIGLNAQTDNIEDLTKAGIFDSTKTLKEIVINSVSVSTMLLSSDVLVINKISAPKINIDNIL